MSNWLHSIVAARGDKTCSRTKPLIIIVRKYSRVNTSTNNVWSVRYSWWLMIWNTTLLAMYGTMYASLHLCRTLRVPHKRSVGIRDRPRHLGDCSAGRPTWCYSSQCANPYEKSGTAESRRKQELRKARASALPSDLRQSLTRSYQAEYPQQKTRAAVGQSQFLAFRPSAESYEVASGWITSPSLFSLQRCPLVIVDNDGY